MVVVRTELRTLHLLSKCLSYDLYPQLMKCPLDPLKFMAEWGGCLGAALEGPGILTLRSYISLMDSSLSEVKFTKTMKRNLRN